jgi:hypothetical protein
MIIVSGRLMLAPGTREEFLAASQISVVAARCAWLP